MTRFRIAKLQRFQTYINDLRLIKIIDEILILKESSHFLSNPHTFFCNFCQAQGPSTACVGTRASELEPGDEADLKPTRRLLKAFRLRR